MKAIKALLMVLLTGVLVSCSSTPAQPEAEVVLTTSDLTQETIVIETIDAWKELYREANFPAQNKNWMPKTYNEEYFQENNLVLLNFTSEARSIKYHFKTITKNNEVVLVEERPETITPEETPITVILQLAKDYDGFNNDKDFTVVTSESK